MPLQHFQLHCRADGAAACLTMSKDVISIYPIAEKILYLREQKVILDRDLARLYGVQTRILNQAVKRNSGRFHWISPSSSGAPKSKGHHSL